MNRRDFIAKMAAGSALLAGGQWMGGVGNASAAPKIGVGWSVGQKAPALAGLDQYMRPTKLKNYKNSWVVLDVSALWCIPCLDSAGNHHAFEEYVTGQGVPLKFFTVLSEATPALTPSTQLHAEQWAATFGLEHEAVLHCDSDPGSPLSNLVVAIGTANGNPAPGFPTYVLIDPEGIVRHYQAAADLDLLQAQLSSLTGVLLDASWTPINEPRPSFGPGITEGTASFTLRDGPAVSQTVQIGVQKAGDQFTLELTEQRHLLTHDTRVLLKLVDTSALIDPTQPISLTLRTVGFARTYNHIPPPGFFNVFFHLQPDTTDPWGADTVPIAYGDGGTSIVVPPTTFKGFTPSDDFNAYEAVITFDHGHPPYSQSLTLDAAVRADTTLAKKVRNGVIKSLKAGRNRLRKRDYSRAASSMADAAETLLAAGASASLQDVANQIAAHTEWLAEHQ